MINTRRDFIASAITAAVSVTDSSGRSSVILSELSTSGANGSKQGSTAFKGPAAEGDSSPMTSTSVSGEDGNDRAEDPRTGGLVSRDRFR
jgi:hypothetical protein